MRIRLFIIAFCISFPSIAASDNQKGSMEMATNFVKARMEFACKATQSSFEQATKEEDREQLKMLMSVSCSCFPEEFDKELQAYQSKGGVTSEDLLISIFNNARTTCTARGMRASTKRLCLLDKKVLSETSDPSVYCQCLENGINGLTDEQIASDSIIAQKNFQEKVRAIKDGKEAPSPIETNYFKVEKQCKQK